MMVNTIELCSVKSEPNTFEQTNISFSVFGRQKYLNWAFYIVLKRHKVVIAYDNKDCIVISILLWMLVMKQWLKSIM